MFFSNPRKYRECVKFGKEVSTLNDLEEKTACSMGIFRKTYFLVLVNKNTTERKLSSAEAFCFITSALKPLPYNVFKMADMHINKF